jgi:ferredoxin
MAVKVWIDQDLCTGDGICEEITPALFGMHHDTYLWHVKTPEMDDIYDGSTDGQPVYSMADGLVDVPDHLLDDCIESADSCPGECIMLEVVDD